jgi:dephospho-CoA kinase
MTPRIGLTGGIGSGKSTVAAMWARLGAALIDIDGISRRLTAPGGGAIDALASAFGIKFITGDGALDRARMRDLVFSDPAQKLRLEAILHPLIGVETERQAREAIAPALVFDVPLLAESGHWRDRVHRVLVVDCSEATQVQRVVARSGLGEATVLGIIAQQASRAKRRACADAVIHNDAVSLDALACEVERLWRIWVQPSSD